MEKEGERKFKIASDYNGVPIEVYEPYGDSFLPLCDMCQNSKMDCPNPYIREVFVPLEEGDPPELEVKEYVSAPDGGLMLVPSGEKFVKDGVEAGIFTSPDRIDPPLGCMWFLTKNTG